MKTQYYGVERSSEYLEHYGIKGMRWGVRKAIERGNERALSRQYRKAARKLARLEARTNASAQLAKAKKWDKISAGARKVGRVGLGVTAATSAFSGLPTSAFGLNRALGRNMLHNKILNDNAALKDKINNAYNGSADAAQWRKEQHAIRNATYEKRMNNLNTADRISRKAQTIGAGLAAGGYAASAIAKIRANQLRNRATGAGHAKAVAEANQFRNEMNKAFAGTKYAGKTAKSKRRRR